MLHPPMTFFKRKLYNPIAVKMKTIQRLPQSCCAYFFNLLACYSHHMLHLQILEHTTFTMLLSLHLVLWTAKAFSLANSYPFKTNSTVTSFTILSENARQIWKLSPLFHHDSCMLLPQRTIRFLGKSVSPTCLWGSLRIGTVSTK